jgi:hypothetical protein
MFPIDQSVLLPDICPSPNLHQNEVFSRKPDVMIWINFRAEGEWMVELDRWVVGLSGTPEEIITRRSQDSFATDKLGLDQWSTLSETDEVKNLNNLSNNDKGVPGQLCHRQAGAGPVEHPLRN